MAGRHPDLARRMLRELGAWLEAVEADRATIDDRTCPDARVHW